MSGGRRGGGRPREVGARKCRPPPRELPPLGCPRRCLPRGSPREIPPSCRLVARRTVPSAVPLCAQVKRECPQCSGARRAWSRSASYGLPIDRSGRAQGLCARSAFLYPQCYRARRMSVPAALDARRACARRACARRARIARRALVRGGPFLGKKVTHARRAVARSACGGSGAHAGL